MSTAKQVGAGNRLAVRHFAVLGRLCVASYDDTEHLR
jgi:hypothetical protein